jgi:hypothetical protein
MKPAFHCRVPRSFEPLRPGSSLDPVENLGIKGWLGALAWTLPHNSESLPRLIGRPSLAQKEVHNVDNLASFLPP